MTDFYQKIGEMQGGIEDLIRKVPGVKQYFEMQDRRAADELLRQQLARKFDEQLSRFTALQSRLLEAGGIKYMDRVQGIHTQFQMFIDRIKTAGDGYSSVFSSAKVDAQALEQVYAFDGALLTYQEQFDAGLRAFEATMGGEEFVGVLGQMESLVVEANNTFSRRIEVLQGLSGAV